MNGAWIESSKCSWLSAPEDLLAKPKEQPFSTRPDYFSKDATPEIALHNRIAAGYRGWLTERAQPGIGKNLIERPGPDIAEDPERRRTQSAGEPKAVKHVAARWRL